MALKASLDSLDGVPEALHTEYKEMEDPKTKKTVYVLDVEGPIEMLPAVRSLKDEAARRRVEVNKANEALAKFKVLGDQDPNDILEKLEKYPELEAAAAGKLDEGKLGKLADERVKVATAKLQRELEASRTEATTFKTENETLKTDNKKRRIGDEVRNHAKTLKVLDTAVDDAVMYGERIFELTEDGVVVTKDNVGVTPGLTPKDWLLDMQKSRPHWWGSSVGGNAPGSRVPGGAAGENPWAAETWNMTKQGQLVVSDRKMADKLAQQAGTTVGGAKPKPKLAKV